MREMIRGDKVGWGYVPAYREMANEIGHFGRVCEIGVHLGHSLEMWKILFPKGKIVGVDINPNNVWPEGTIRVVADQTDESLPFQLKTVSGFYDLIVEDASHIAEKSRQTFLLLWPLVATGGWYVIEDWHIGFPNFPGIPHPEMLELAQQFLYLLDNQEGDIESIIYRFGQIIFQKKG